jgi:circadian clock protein KaiC
VTVLIEHGLEPDSEQSILHPPKIEPGETVEDVIARVDKLKPIRVVFDSLSELRLLAQSPLRYRRQILALKQFFDRRACTVLMLDDWTSETGDVQLRSSAHGVISLEPAPREFGPERRRLRIIKRRGIKFRGAYHDFTFETGGIKIFPRLVAAVQESVPRRSNEWQRFTKRPTRSPQQAFRL